MVTNYDDSIKRLLVGVSYETRSIVRSPTVILSGCKLSFKLSVNFVNFINNSFINIVITHTNTPIVYLGWGIEIMKNVSYGLKLKPDFGGVV